MNFFSMLDRASPIGIIPDRYQHLDELCKLAHIRYHPVTTEITIIHRDRYQDPITGTIETRQRLEKAKRSWVDWSVTYDAKQYPTRSVTISGKQKEDFGRLHSGTLEHAKFCAVLDYVILRGERGATGSGARGRLDRINVLDVAIGAERFLRFPNGTMLDLGAKVKSMLAGSYADAVAELQAIGAKKYESVQQRQAQVDLVREAATLFDEA